MVRPKSSTSPKTPSARNGLGPSPSSASRGETIFEMPLDELQKRVEQSAVLMNQAIALLPGYLIMTAQDRRHSPGRLRSGEGAIYLDVISIIEEYPAFFEGLADLDEGVDPSKVETGLLRDRIQRAEILAPLVKLTEKFVGISDSVLHLRGQVRQPVTEAYGIAKSLARTNAAIRSRLAKAIDYYASFARVAAATRKANAAAKQPK